MRSNDGGENAREGNEEAPVTLYDPMTEPAKQMVRLTEVPS
jgi:hypothetical protein